jgi:hypothetical protein
VFLTQTFEQTVPSHRASSRSELKTSELGLAHVASLQILPRAPFLRLHVRITRNSDTLIIINFFGCCVFKDEPSQKRQCGQTMCPRSPFTPNTCAEASVKCPRAGRSILSDLRMRASPSSDVIAGGPRTWLAPHSPSVPLDIYTEQKKYIYCEMNNIKTFHAS